VPLLSRLIPAYSFVLFPLQIIPRLPEFSLDAPGQGFHHLVCVLAALLLNSIPYIEIISLYTAAILSYFHSGTLFFGLENYYNFSFLKKLLTNEATELSLSYT
jgi:hypothetical protein